MKKNRAEEVSGDATKGTRIREKPGWIALTLSEVSLTLLAPTLAWATSTARVGRWDTTLNLIKTDLSGPVAHALVTSAFVGSEVLYATCGHGTGVSRLAVAGLGGAAALGAVFPGSPILF